MGGKCVGTCSIEGCSNAVLARGWCSKHYSRWSKNGDPIEARPYRRDATCTIEGCERPHKGLGYCGPHLRRLRKHGDPNIVQLGGRPLKGDYPGWAAVHKRIARTRGKATAYTCVDCGDNAREWSYDGADPDELIGLAGGFMLAYSLDPDHYEPRCVPCHRKFDQALRRTITAVTE